VQSEQGFYQLGFPPRRNGFRGITKLARRRVRQGAQLLEEDPKLCGFWTITLSDEMTIELADRDAWHVFQGAIRSLLVRKLRRLGMPALAVAVVELQPKRSEELHMPIPHLHVLFKAKKHRKDSWPLGPGDFDLIIFQALLRCGIVIFDLESAGKIESIRRSAAGYISKYMTKAQESNFLEFEEYILCPRQWFFITKDLLEMVKSNTFELPSAFLAWLVSVAEPNDRGQLYSSGQVPNLPRGAPSCWSVSFRSADAIWVCLEAWETDCVSAVRHGKWKSGIRPGPSRGDCVAPGQKVGGAEA
jgi:hypothetical protein